MRPDTDSPCGLSVACRTTAASGSWPPADVAPSLQSFPSSSIATLHLPLRGYTLVELLVVMILLGIAAGAVTLSVAPSEERRVTEELLRLGALFRLAQDEARTTGRPVTWEADVDGYRFRRGDPALADAGDDPLRPRRWPFGVTRIDAPAIVFGREPLLERTDFTIVAQSRQWRVGIDALGRVSLAQ